MLHKVIPLSGVKAGPDDGLAEGQFTGYASVFDNIDSYGDVVVKGAFANDLVEWKASGDPIPVLYGHNTMDPFCNIGGTLDAVEDDHGLLVKSQLDLDNPTALQVYRLLKGRRVKQMSFAYDVIAGGFAVRPRPGGTGDDDKQEYFELRELKLYEVSVVPIGANQETEILGVKSLAHVAERALQLKAGRTLSAKNETALRDAYESIGKVLSTLDVEQDEDKASADRSSRQSDPQGTAAKARGAGDEATVTASTELDLLELETQLEQLT